MIKGITQVFPMIVACVHDEHSILAIEQPELHIHSRIQQQIADMFIAKRSERLFSYRNSQ